MLTPAQATRFVDGIMLGGQGMATGYVAQLEENTRQTQKNFTKHSAHIVKLQAQVLKLQQEAEQHSMVHSVMMIKIGEVFDEVRRLKLRLADLEPKVTTPSSLEAASLASSDEG
jgi:hypothetical protein